MYSIVLMMAMTGSADVPASHGCNGCAGCNGSSCSGCKGGGFCGHSKGCTGCAGCYGNGGCQGKSHSCCHKSKGCCGCNGGCWAYTTACGCNGAVAAPAGKDAGKGDSQKMEDLDQPKKKEEKKDTKKKTALEAAPATIVVNLPADATLTIDDATTASTSATRIFTSPVLEQGKDFFYTFKAEIVKDGKTITTSKRVAVHAGEEAQISLDFPQASLAQR